MTSEQPLTIGTAGHIDHGKTALVAALTGVQTDRLAEERRRGLTIELGYARLVSPTGRQISLVDVPGHERFVRTMVAGATGIDCYLLCVAADDGVMPQTREHIAVLRGLGIDRGVVAVTKADVADSERAVTEIAELLPGIEAVAVSATEGSGLEALSAALDRMLGSVPSRAATPGPARLHVDRSFTVNGAGTVATGTLWAGELVAGDRVRILPSGDEARVRTVEVHGERVEQARAGQRVALNLARTSRDAISRGDVVCGADADLAASTTVEVELDGARELDGERVQVHHGTREAAARVVMRGAEVALLRLEAPLLPAAGDRLVLRRIAPPGTIGGATVRDPAARRGRARPAIRTPGRVEREPALAPALNAETLALEERLRTAGSAPPLDSELGEVADELEALRRTGRAARVGPRMHFHPEALERVRDEVRTHLAKHGSITVAELRDVLGTSRKYAQALLEHLDGEKMTVRSGDRHLPRRAAVSP